MPGLIVFLACTGWAAWRFAAVLSAREPEPLTRVEKYVWAGVLALALWLAQGYILAVLGRFRPMWLVATSLLLLTITLAATRRHGFSVPSIPRGLPAPLRERLTRALGREVVFSKVLPLTFVGVCVAYSAAALLVLPVSNHDALSYHFPKAVWLTTTGAFGLYPSQDLRITYFPGNYEMLAATFLTFLRSDTLTGLITTASLVLFLASSFCLFTRVWKDTLTALLTLPVMLASPVLFLHATAHKNDILMAAVTFNALLWLGRSAVHGGAGSAVVGVVAFALAAGTKFHGLFLAPAASVLLWRAWRGGTWRPNASAAARQAGLVAGMSLLLGGVQYVANIINTGQITGILQIATPNAMNTVAYPAFWQLPRFTWMLLAAPLLSGGQYFTVPWTGERWFWPAYELYFSHYGIHVTLLVLLLPLAIRWTRRQLDAQTRAELTGISLAALVLLALNMLVGLRPYGGFAFIPRFLFFALPVLLVWTWCAGVRWLGAARRLSWVPLAASLVLPMSYVGIAASQDRFSPFEYVALLWNAPEWRREIFQTNWRSASVVDRLAPPDATVAIDAGYDGWTYPLYGARISRKVQVIVDGRDAYVPGPDVGWVAIDHAFTTVWGHPDFTDMRQAFRYIDRGPLRESEMLVYRRLERNPDFELVYFDQARFQAVFRRVKPVPAPVNPDAVPAPGTVWQHPDRP